MHRDGLRRWRRLVRSHRAIEGDRTAVPRRADPGLVRTDGAGHEPHPRTQDPSPRPEDTKHIPNFEGRRQDRRLRYRPSLVAHIRLRADCHRYALLLESGDLLGTPLQPKIRHLVVGVYPL